MGGKGKEKERGMEEEERERKGRRGEGMCRTSAILRRTRLSMAYV